MEEILLTRDKNFSNIGITEILGGQRLRNSGEFFISKLWRMIAPNTLNKSSSYLIASVESSAHSKLSGITENLGAIMAKIIKVDFLNRKITNIKSENLPSGINSEVYSKLKSMLSCGVIYKNGSIAKFNEYKMRGV